jgi:hypothetical protein
VKVKPEDKAANKAPVRKSLPEKGRRPAPAKTRVAPQEAKAARKAPVSPADS